MTRWAVAAHARTMQGTLPYLRFEDLGINPQSAAPATRHDALRRPMARARAGLTLWHILERRFHQILAITSFSSFEHSHSGP